MHLPESLKPRPGHLNPAQQRVYEDFARIPRGAAGAHAAVGGGKPLASMDKVCLHDHNLLQSGKSSLLPTVRPFVCHHLFR